MRKLLWSAVAVSLLAAGLGVHFMLKMRGGHTVVVQPGPAEEEQEAPRAAFVPMPGHMPTVERLLEAMEIIEPIDVENTPPAPPPGPEFAGAWQPGTKVQVEALKPKQPPRPDEQQGERQRMPYAEAEGFTWRGMWECLVRQVVRGHDTEPTLLNETAEPPTAEEQSEPMPVKTPLPPVIDYQYHSHEMHCPYTGRCPVPLYPVAPPAAPPHGK